MSQSGDSLGRVTDFAVDAVTQNIAKFYVQGELLGRLKEPLIIDISQVIEIKEGEIVVDDAALPKNMPETAAPDYGTSGV